MNDFFIYSLNAVLVIWLVAYYFLLKSNVKQIENENKRWRGEVKNLEKYFYETSHEIRSIAEASGLEWQPRSQGGWVKAKGEKK